MKKIELVIKKCIPAIQLFLLIGVIAGTILVNKRTAKIRSKLRRISQAIDVDSHLRTFKYNFENNFVPPSQLKHYASLKDFDNLVLNVKKIDIRNVPHPYNASLIDKEDGNFWLFFRFDEPKELPLSNELLPLKTFIGVVELDKNFCQTEKEVKWIDTNSLHSEDPRVFIKNNEYYIVYNDIVPIRSYSRTIRLASLEKNTFNVKYTTQFDLHISPIEKNWVPFIVNENDVESAHFVYQINPHKILKIKNLFAGEVEHLSFKQTPPFHSKLWPKDWGTPRGGCPAKLVDGRYLSFFHSAMKNSQTGVVWYIMGAYTFEEKPPYRITAISTKPIFFKGIYDTPYSSSANKKLHCIFPAGFTLDKIDNLEVIHLSCGENDSGVKIITLDKNKLLSSLSEIDYSIPENPDLIASQ